MKQTDEEIEIIAKSMYKAVKKALGTAIGGHARNKAREESGKDAVDDLMDDNFIAEAKAKVPPKRTAQMNKALSETDKLKAKINREKGISDRRKAKQAKIEDNDTTARAKNLGYHKDSPSFEERSKGKLPLVKSEKGVTKLKQYIKNKRK